jgi:hypothetical protein
MVHGDETPSTIAEKYENYPNIFDRDPGLRWNSGAGVLLGPLSFSPTPIANGRPSTGVSRWRSAPSAFGWGRWPSNRLQRKGANLSKSAVLTVSWWVIS